jgi:hypothetical protein
MTNNGKSVSRHKSSGFSYRKKKIVDSTQSSSYKKPKVGTAPTAVDGLKSLKAAVHSQNNSNVLKSLIVKAAGEQ